MAFEYTIEGFERDEMDELVRLIRSKWQVMGSQRNKTRIVVVSNTIKLLDFPRGKLDGIPVRVQRKEKPIQWKICNWLAE